MALAILKSEWIEISWLFVGIFTKPLKIIFYILAHTLSELETLVSSREFTIHKKMYPFSTVKIAMFLQS